MTNESTDPLMRLAEEIRAKSAELEQRAMQGDLVTQKQEVEIYKSILTQHLQSEPVGFIVRTKSNVPIATVMKDRFDDLSYSSILETHQSASRKIQYLYTTPQLKPDVVEQARALCQKFVDKVESGRAHSKETYAECKALLQTLNGE